MRDFGWLVPSAVHIKFIEFLLMLYIEYTLIYSLLMNIRPRETSLFFFRRKLYLLKRLSKSADLSFLFTHFIRSIHIIFYLVFFLLLWYHGQNLFFNVFLKHSLKFTKFLMKMIQNTLAWVVSKRFIEINIWNVIKSVVYNASTQSTPGIELCWSL